MGKNLFIKLVLLLLIGVLMMLIKWELLSIIRVCYVTLPIGFIGFYFLWKSLTRKRQRVKRQVMFAVIITVFWYTILPYIIMYQIKIPIEDLILVVLLFEIAALIVMLIVIIKELPDIDCHSGNSKWIDFARKDLAFILLSAISFTTAIILSLCSCKTDVSPMFAVGYLLVGIFSLRIKI